MSQELGSVLDWIEAHRAEAIADLQRYCLQPSVAAQHVGLEEMRALVVEALHRLGAAPSEVPATGEPMDVGLLEGTSARRLAMDVKVHESNAS